MASPADWRKLALSLPETEEKSHFGQPDFRVRNKIFAGLDPDERRGVLKLRPEVQSLLIDGKPKVFSPAAGAWGRSGWTHVEVAAIETGALADLLREAWSLVAPKKLLAADSGKPASRRKRTKR
ncbi:MAG TPA: MmcQ/YjbR family DNA-binding protein [Polyangiales bacterium]|jgi:hypothetical protein|nr:MmcQ/YjbR family DNA-binding protein [Polyangiales bacterium]